MTKRCIVLLILTTLTGCASISERRRHQYVLVKSEPPGAEILLDGKVIGATPGLIHLKRSRSKSLALRHSEETQNLYLETRYRWADSFFTNLWLISAAPVGWLIDFSTGSAWHFQDPNSITFKSRQITQGLKNKSVISVAPPLAENSITSDEAAKYWQEKLTEAEPNSKVNKYPETLLQFQKAGFEYDSEPSNPQLYREVLYQTKANEIFLSKVTVSEGKFELEGKK